MERALFNHIGFDLDMKAVRLLQRRSFLHIREQCRGLLKEMKIKEIKSHFL